MQKTPFVFPIIGGRKIEHLNQNVEGLKIALSDAQIKELEESLPFDPGFPNTMIVSLFFLKSLNSVSNGKLKGRWNDNELPPCERRVL